MRRIWLLPLLVLVVTCVTAEEITVAAAADLNYALNDLAHRFETTTGNKVKLSFGASGNLYSQIQNGAPFDIFFSADEDYPKKLANAGAADAASLRIYAVGHLVLWVPNSSPFDPQALKMDLLTQSKVARIAIANPQHAPYGRAAMSALEHYGLKRQGRRQVSIWRERQSGGAIRAVRKCAGRTGRAVSCQVTGDGVELANSGSCRPTHTRS